MKYENDVKRTFTMDWIVPFLISVLRWFGVYMFYVRDRQQLFVLAPQNGIRYSDSMANCHTSTKRSYHI